MSSEPISTRVLHVDDDRDFAEMARAFIEREADDIDVVTTTSASEGLDRLADDDVDCVVSDYDMPGTNGIEFLEAVRRDDPGLPFILFTGKGSEEIASEAISAGVTDYLQKRHGTERYQLLVNRIANAVAKHRAERELETTRRRYERLISESSDVIVVVDPGGVFEYVSPSCDRVLGYHPDELVGENGFEYIHPDDRPDAVELFESMVADPERRPTVEFRFDHRDGSWTWIEARGRNLLDDPIIGGIVVYARDVTDRREQADRFEALVEHSSDIVTVVETDGTITYESPSIERVLGYTPEELLGENAFEYVHPDDRERTLETFTEAIEADDGAIRNAIYRFRDADGSWVWLETVGSIPRSAPYDGIVLNTRDITHQKERERALERYETMVNRTGDLVYAADADGRLTAVNDAAADFVGHSPDELVGRHVSAVLTDESVERGREVIGDLLGSEDLNGATYAMEVVTADGRTIPCENHVTLIENDIGELRGSVGVVRDRSDR